MTIISSLGDADLRSGYLVQSKKRKIILFASKNGHVIPVIGVGLHKCLRQACFLRQFASAFYSNSIMERHVITMLGDGNCLFRAISYCVFNTDEHHRDIRLQVVAKIKNEWEGYVNFIVGDLSYRLPIHNSNEYEILSSLDGEPAGHVELY